MDEKAKLMLYRQLQEMSELNQKGNAASLISEQEFLALSDKEALKYTFEYRDRETDFGEDIYYLEMPDMDFQGQDLSDVSISRFMLSRVEDGKRVPSKINVNGTRIAINLNGIGISEQSQDELGVSGQVIDFNNVDFRGCEIRGILPDEYAEETKSKTRGQITVAGRENLDYRYLQRRKEHQLTSEERKVTERAYARLLSGGTLKGTRDQDMIDFTDYDLEGLSKEQMRYLMYREEITLDTYQIESSRHYGIPYRRMKEATENRSNEVKLAYEKGDMAFVEEHFTELDDEQKLSVIEKEYQRGNLNFVVRHFDDLTYTMRNKIATTEYEKGNMAFVEQHFEYLDEDLKKAMVESAYKEGNTTFVEQHFKYLDEELKEVIVKTEYEKGNVEFARAMILKLNLSQRSRIVLFAYRNNDLNFFTEMMAIDGYGDVVGSTTVGKILEKEYKKGNLEFVNKHLYGAGGKSTYKIIRQEYQKGNVEFLKNNWWKLSQQGKNEMLKMLVTSSDVETIDDLWKQFTEENKEKIARQELKRGNTKYIKELLEKEKEKKELHGQKEVSCSGRILSTELLKDDIDRDFVIRLIRTGSGLNYVVYRNSNRRSPEYIPTLYQALKIKDNDTRKQIVSEMLKAGVNIDSKYVKISYLWDDRGEKTEEHCLEVNNGELIQIMSELGMEVPQEKKVITTPEKSETRQAEPKQDNRVLVSDFLTHEVGLSEEEIKKLETTYRGWGRNLYSLSTERLGMQKAILDSVGGTKRAFTTDAKVLNNDPQVLYSRLMFYRESGITVMPDRLYTTLGISKKGFAKNFGSRVLEQGNMEEADYEYKLKQELLKRYPMPETRDELKRTLEELNKEEIGG